jgi:hypothetical protein
VVCNAVTGSQTANITVTAQGVTSNSVAVSVHPKVARVVVTPGNPPCASQGVATNFSAQAFDILGNDITSLIGTFTWSVADTTIATLAGTTTPGTSPANSVVGVLPGTTTVTATVNSTNPVNSVAAVFQECPVAQITIVGPDSTKPNLAFSPSPGTVGNTGQLTATVTDTAGAAVSNVPLTWLSSQAVSSTVSSSGLVTAVAAGTSSITASCALGTCNRNQNSLVTSNTVVASVSGTSAAGIVVYATSSLGGNTSLVPIDTTANTPQTAIPLPSTPNSLVFDNTGAVGYLGSDGGLMVLSPSTNSLTKTVTNAPGQVLAVSPNGGQFVIIGGKLSNGNPTATLLFNNSTNALTTLNISNAVAADFSPDGTEAVVADTADIRTVQGTAVRVVTGSGAGTSVSFLANGALAYLGASGAPSVVACNSFFHAGTTPGTPTLVKSLPDGSKVLGVELPSLAVTGVALGAPPAGSCQPSITETPAVLSFGVGGTPHAGRIFVTPDGTHAYVTSDVAGKLLSYDVVGNVAGSIALTGTAPVTFTQGTLQDIRNNGGATLDSASVYVGVNDGGSGSVHQINVSAGTDAAQIPLSFVPDLVAVRPH